MSKTFETEETGVGKCPDCTVEAGAVFDNENCAIDIVEVFSTEMEAKDALAFYTRKAREAESEPCAIAGTVSAVEGGWQLHARFDFCCQAEAVIFRLSVR
ncbi:YfcZ/YiiS family protein [Neisseria dentiae]|uniref:YfcZ/YiiS family protein n=1 Tax=Neisseria dentiae TaxID=194197 RepID=UPI00359FC24C